jgi:hypothetical protein
MWVTQTILERLENNMLKWYRRVVRMDDKIWRKRIMSWSPEGRRRRRRAEGQWEKEVESVMKQRAISSDHALKR